MKIKKTILLFIRGEGLIPMSVNFKNFYHGVHGVSREPPTALRQGVLTDKYDWFRRKKSLPHTMGLAGFIQPSAPRRKKVFSYQNSVVLRDLRGYILLKLTHMGLIPHRTAGTRSAARYFILMIIISISACTKTKAHEQDDVKSDLQYNSESDFKVEREGNGITITKYLGTETEVRIPPGIQNHPVTSIGRGAFAARGSLGSVTIPNGVTSIEDGAFYGCASLISITIPNSITSIGNSAFIYCRHLTSITIPDNVISIGNSAFSYCDRLTSVTIGNSVTNIGNDVFEKCESLKNITIKTNKVTNTDENNWGTRFSVNNLVVTFEDVTSIDDYAFSGCTRFASVTIPDSVTGIGDYAFSGCINLASVTIPNSVTDIESGVFKDCANLTEIKVAAGNSAYIAENGVLYNKNKTSLHTYPVGKIDDYFTIPESVEIIGDSAFSDCWNLTSITIPDSVISIGKEAFEDCYKITSVTFQSTIPSNGFDSDAFDSGLRDKFYEEDEDNGTPGTYTTTSPVSYNSTWAKQ